MIHCEKCLTVYTNSVGSGTVLCNGCQTKARIAALEDVVRELVAWGDYDTDNIQGDWPAMRTKALELLNEEK